MFQYHYVDSFLSRLISSIKAYFRNGGPSFGNRRRPRKYHHSGLHHQHHQQHPYIPPGEVYYPDEVVDIYPFDELMIPVQEHYHGENGFETGHGEREVESTGHDIEGHLLTSFEYPGPIEVYYHGPKEEEEEEEEGAFFRGNFDNPDSAAHSIRY